MGANQSRIHAFLIGDLNLSLNKLSNISRKVDFKYFTPSSYMRSCRCKNFGVGKIVEKKQRSYEDGVRNPPDLLRGPAEYIWKV